MQPGTRPRIALILALLLSAGVALGALVSGALSVISTLSGAPIIASVSLNPEDLEGLVAASTTVGVTPLFPSYADVALTGLSADAVVTFAVARGLEALVLAVSAGLVAVAAARALAGRGSWGSFARMSTVLGVVIAAGGTVASALGKQAADLASSEIARADGTWVEPGFLAGISPMPLVIGALLLACAPILRVTARHAADADGVI